MENNNNIVDTLNNIASNSVITSLSGDEIYELRDWLIYYKKIRAWFLFPIGIVVILVVCVGAYYKVDNVEKNFVTLKSDSEKAIDESKQNIKDIDNKLDNKANSNDISYLRNKIDELEKKVLSKK